MTIVCWALSLLALPARAQLASSAPAVWQSTQPFGMVNDRIFWVIPNNRTVDAPPDHFPPISPGEKLAIGVSDSIDPYAFPIAGIYAGLAQVQNQYPSWGRGVTGFEKRYVASLADQTLSNVLAESVFPIALHEDPRYFRLGRGGFWRRTGYAISRNFLIQTDGGGLRFNTSEYGGNLAMAGLSNFYIPRADRTLGNTAMKWGLQVGLDMVFNVMKEFWPDIKRALLRR